MEQANWWLMDIVGPAILLIVLIWLVLRVRSNRNDSENRRAEQGTRDLYAEEEQRRRDGTDQL
jgi:membrane protein implicated in regulation of membrane protease activity